MREWETDHWSIIAADFKSLEVINMFTKGKKEWENSVEKSVQYLIMLKNRVKLTLTKLAVNKKTYKKRQANIKPSSIVLFTAGDEESKRKTYQKIFHQNYGQHSIS